MKSIPLKRFANDSFDQPFYVKDVLKATMTRYAKATVQEALNQFRGRRQQQIQKSLESELERQVTFYRLSAYAKSFTEQLFDYLRRIRYLKKSLL